MKQVVNKENLKSPSTLFGLGAVLSGLVLPLIGVPAAVVTTVVSIFAGVASIYSKGLEIDVPEATPPTPEPPAPSK